MDELTEPVVVFNELFDAVQKTNTWFAHTVLEILGGTYLGPPATCLLLTPTAAIVLPAGDTSRARPRNRLV